MPTTTPTGMRLLVPYSALALFALQRDRVQDSIFLYKTLSGGWQAGAGDLS